MAAAAESRPIFSREIEISDVARELWEAPFAVLAHDIEVGYGLRCMLQRGEGRAHCCASGRAAGHQRQELAVCRTQEVLDLSSLLLPLWVPLSPLCVLQEGEPDRFCYGNKAALALFECT